MRAADLARKIPNAKRRGDRWDALCPAHDDTRASFTFHDDDEHERVGLFCRRGCTAADIAKALNLSLADLHHTGPGRETGSPHVSAEYPYHDETGALLYVVERLDPKGFRQKRPNGRGGWIYKLGDVRRVVFGLTDLAGAPLVLVPEGEKDVRALRALGLVATCNPQGAGKWSADYTRQLVAAGVREVAILPDHDDAGERHAHAVARSCADAGLGVKMIELPGLERKHDVSDWLAAGHTRDELLALVEAAPAWAPVSAPARSTVWESAKSAAQLLAEPAPAVTWLDYPLCARGAITEINAPRGTGKSVVVLSRMVTLARGGLRVLYLDRDNPPGVLRKRLAGLRAHDVTTLRVLNRTAAPPLADTEQWQAFPPEAFDIIVLDSWDTFAEGVGEQDSRRTTLALVPLLDLARRDVAPAVIVLGNVTKDGARGRGSGVLEDRADLVYEARDVTGFTPTGRRPWWEELPAAGRNDWAERVTRRTKRERRSSSRLALISTKVRDEEDPAPVVYEIDFASDPWTARDVTATLVEAGDVSRAQAADAAAATLSAAGEALVAELTRLASGGGEPLLKKRAEALLVESGLTQKAARKLLKSGGGGRWHPEPLDDDRRAVSVRLTGVSGSTPTASRTSESPPPERASSAQDAVARMATGQPHSTPANTNKHAGPVDSQMRLPGYLKDPDAAEDEHPLPPIPEPPATTPEAAGAAPADGDGPVDLELPPRRGVRL